MLLELQKEALSLISEFDTNKNNYIQVSDEKIISKSTSNKVYVKNKTSLGKIKRIKFNDTVTGSSIFIGDNLKGSIEITIQQSKGVVYIGNDCNLREVDIRTQALGSCVLIGNRISTSGKNKWHTGPFPGSSYSSILIGDDCLFSYDVTVRASDGHPVMSFDFTSQLNSPKNFTIIEPYVWVGQDATILKSVRIGACSIVGSSAVVTKSTPKFSRIFGVPAKFESLEGIWLKDRTEQALSIAKMHMKNNIV